MKYKIIERLSSADYEKLALLINKCNGYEPFYLMDEDMEPLDGYGADGGTEDFADYSPDELHQLAAYDSDNNMVGFISFIYDEDFNFCTDSDSKDYYYKNLSRGMPKDLPELTALVAPEYRHQGIFSEMFSRIKADTGINAFIVSGNLQKEPAFSEYLMKLTYDEHNNSYKPDVSSKCRELEKSDISCACNEHCADECYSFCFEEHDCVYAMYGSGEAIEEIACCRLNLLPSFTVISSVYVKEEMRGNGLGSVFMEHFIMNYFSKYTKPLVLNVRSINIPALRLYNKYGFKIVETVKYYVI